MMEKIMILPLIASLAIGFVVIGLFVWVLLQLTPDGRLLYEGKKVRVRAFTDLHW